MTKPLPKSLHTVTVLVRLAKAFMPREGTNRNERAVNAALRTLGYSTIDENDPYGLGAVALAQLDAGGVK